jgi:hypothetical protein
LHKPETQTDGKTGWQLLPEAAEDQVFLPGSSLGMPLWAEQRRQNERQYPAGIQQHSLLNLYRGGGVSVVAKSKSLKTAFSQSFADLLSQAAQGTWTAARGPIFANR